MMSKVKGLPAADMVRRSLRVGPFYGRLRQLDMGATSPFQKIVLSMFIGSDYTSRGSAVLSRAVMGDLTLVL